MMKQELILSKDLYTSNDKMRIAETQKNMKKIILITIAFMGSIALSAQQDAMFTHYMFNTLAVNPGYAGSRDALTITGLHRSQWVSFPGAPTTQTLTMHTPMLKDKLGLGLSVINDKIGPTHNTSGFLDLAYRLPVSDKGTLVFGVKAGVNILQGDIASLATQDSGDQSLSSNIKSDLQPNFGAGVYYHSEKFYVGLSAPGFLENDFGAQDGNGLTRYTQQRHYFLIAGTVFSLSDKVDFKPTGFLKVTDAAPIEADITGTFLLNQKVWLGLMYRTGDAAGLLAGVQITDQLAAGYSYDFSFTNKTITYNGGSHEIMLRYDFIINEKGKIRSPRYF
jgi:type IX secretion system PorP/SprF family membrane protein